MVEIDKNLWVFKTILFSFVYMFLISRIHLTEKRYTIMFPSAQQKYSPSLLIKQFWYINLGMTQWRKRKSKKSNKVNASVYLEKVRERDF